MLEDCWLTQLCTSLTLLCCLCFRITTLYNCTCVRVCMQTQLVQGMAEAGEDALAEEYRKQLGLPEDTLAPPDPGQSHTHLLR
jgi:hypothetical protein